MSAKSILEADGKAILNYHLTRAPVIKPTPLPASATHNPPPKLASLHFAADEDVRGVLDQAESTYPWLLAPGAKFVAKPDQLIKRRGKSGLLALNKTWAEAKEWIAERAGKPQRVETVDGVLRQFLVEPFVPHPDGTEYYININSVREVRPFPSFAVISFFTSSASSSRPKAVAEVQEPCCRCDGSLQRVRAKTLKLSGARRFCFKAARTKGDSPTHFCKAPTLCDTHVHFHMSYYTTYWLLTTLLVQSHLLGRWCCGSSLLDFGDRAYHFPIPMLTSRLG
tara:strand:- start:6243 stop:7085 length:843 start_codon:yes stop_codon:yes gene_type:complete